MRSITSEELSALAGELRELEGFYIDKFYELSEDRFMIRLTRSGAQANLQIILSHTINKTEYVEKHGMPTNFASAVRKRIGGFRIQEVAQLNNDRIVVFGLKKGDVTLNFIVEMFGRGNLVITDNNMRILLAQKTQETKDRTIRNGLEYRPPAQPAGYKSEKPKDIAPVLYRKEGKAVDYSIRELGRHAGLDAERFGTLQELLDQFYYENPVGKAEDGNPEQRRLVEELASSIRKQERLLESIDTEIAASKEKGRMLMEGMESVNAIIDAARRNRRITKEELQRMFPNARILNVDLKNKKIKLEMD